MRGATRIQVMIAPLIVALLLVCGPAWAQDPVDELRLELERLKAEARSMAMLRHPNVVGVHDIFVGSDTGFIVLDLLPGGAPKVQFGDG